MWLVPASTVLLGLAALLPTRAERDNLQQQVESWTGSFGNIISEVCVQNTARNNISKAYRKQARVEEVDAMYLLSLMANDMISMMRAKTEAVRRIVDTAEIAAMSHREKAKLDVSYYNAKKLNEFVAGGQNVSMLQEGYREFELVGNSSKHFSGIPVNMTHSTVHVPTNVYDKSMEVNNTIKWSEKLDRAFTSNFEIDPSLSWQYFGSATGIMRQYPGMKWLVNPDEPDMFDCRMREWYIRAASSPKDLIILLDLSGSMTGLRVEIAKHVVLNILDTLNTNDYVNIYNFSQAAEPPLVPCFNNTLVQANLENVRIFKDHLDNVKTHGLANFTLALTKAFDILTEARGNNESRSSLCNQAIMLVTDGAPEKFEQVFKDYNRPDIRVRVFTYLIGRDVADREAVEWMACSNKGYFTHVTTLAEVREQVQKYVPVLARPLVLSCVANDTARAGRLSDDHPVIWTGVYADIAGRTDNEATKRGYRLVTSISIPVFDRLKEPRKNVAQLLGVAGTDVPLSDIQKHAPPYQLGVNGYSFIIDNNGYILYHPDLRPVHREATKQFQEILKPNYKTVDLAEVEIVDDDEPRYNHSKLFELRKAMIDGAKAEHSFTVRQHLDDMKRVITRRQKYLHMPLRSTPFSLGIVLPEGYGQRMVKGQEEVTQAARYGAQHQILEYFEGPNWSVHPEWVYCEYDNDAHSLDTPRAQYLHFLRKAMRTQGFEWRSQRMYPTQTMKEPNEQQFRKPVKKEEKTYYCDRELFQSVVFDAKVTMSFKQGRGQSNSEEQFNTFGAVHTFVATRSGFTRWKSYWPEGAEVDIEPDNLQFNATRATDEVWYKRAVDYHHRINDRAFVYSVPFDAALRNDSLVTVAQAVFVEDGGFSSPAAVVGMQFLHSAFRKKFLSSASCSSLSMGNCTETCASDSLDCYLLDDSGFVIVSKRREETGKFFGDVDGTVMDALLKHRVYSKVRMFDYQGVCLDVVSTGSSAWTLLTPFKYIQNLARWAGVKLLWLLVQSSLLHLYDINLAWAAERTVNDYTESDYPGGEHGQTVSTDDGRDEPPVCNKVEDDKLFNMAHIRKTRPRPCDKQVDLYTRIDKTKAFGASLNHCLAADQTCDGRFVLEPVPLTNLLMVVVSTLCPCENDKISIEPEEVPYPNDTVCERLLTEPYRRRPDKCKYYHVQEESLDEMCGRSSVAPLAATAASGWLLTALALLVSSSRLLT